ncbi:SAM-dependent methyltransferase [Yinghuangia seranimata]|uniref:SAM-dependent methyltransferase n=1 Tax=Yinghuangia seranimata TaxID=408067 RepID=UPI00248B1368|nr:SAM-dependent methyltransferase [Yinghuangia seranimata]MDI2129836.1 SAM-dependent methyltransferase [Yinghuangia seranimata]
MSVDAIPGIPEGVGRTALGVARLRAEETERSDRLFADPYAGAFVAAGGPAAQRLRPARGAEGLREAMFWKALTLSVVVRTKWLDEAVDAALAEGVRQVVLLGAGLDCRAYRLAWPPGSRVFELDQPQVLEFKRHVLADAEPACDRTAIACDLLADWPTRLQAAGFRAHEPTLWMAEGLLVYFEQADNERLAREIHKLSAPGSRLAVTMSAAGGLHPSARDGVATSLSHMWRSGTGDPAVWLNRLGWSARSWNVWDKAADYGRGFPGGRTPPRPSWLVLATADAP